MLYIGQLQRFQRKRKPPKLRDGLIKAPNIGDENLVMIDAAETLLLLQSTITPAIHNDIQSVDEQSKSSDMANSNECTSQVINVKRNST